jgi:hypothetical protein
MGIEMLRSDLNTVYRVKLDIGARDLTGRLG